MRHERSRGVAEARNTGIDAAQGTWVAFLDDDDVWATTRLAEQLAALEPAAWQWSFTGCTFLDEDLTPQGGTAPPLGLVTVPAMRRGNRIGTPSAAVVSRAPLLRAGRFDPRFSIMADWELWLRLTELEPPVEVAARLTGYVRHDESCTAASPPARSCSSSVACAACMGASAARACVEVAG